METQDAVLRMGGAGGRSSPAKDPASAERTQCAFLRVNETRRVGKPEGLRETRSLF